jgi:DNA repair protein RadC
MHEGHRQRLYAKLEEDDNLYEHELLEILLFNAYPRRDTNPIAHALLEKFASIQEIINADVNELCTVEGVGRNVALYLKCIGKCVSGSNCCKSFAVVKNIDEFKQFISRRFRGKDVEFLELYFLDKAGRVKRISSFTSGDADRVNVKSEEIARLISVFRPYGIFMAHNHVDCDSQPSHADDAFTKRIMLICKLSNVRFYDHCIYVADNDIYSYYSFNRLDKINIDQEIEVILKNGKQI